MISTIEIKNGSLDLYDATVSQPPMKTRLEQINGTIQDVASPASEKTRFELAGIVKGVRRHGRANLSGWVGPDARDSSSRVALAAVDLVALQPYLVRKNEARVANGTLDLNLASEVRNPQFERQRQSGAPGPGVCAVAEIFRHVHGAAAQRGDQFSQRSQQRHRYRLHSERQYHEP